MLAGEFPALREADAKGDVAAIFSDLRATLHVPFVNLIWRHLATIPDMLEWAWQAGKPLYTSVEHAEVSTELRQMVSPPAIAKTPSFIFDSIGLTIDDRALIAELIGAYNRANASNLIALLVVQSLLGGSKGAGRGLTHRVAASAQATPRSLPALPQLSELNGSLQNLVTSLDQFGRVAPSSAVASLYCHLAYWPPFLAIVHTALLSAHESGALRAEQARVLQRGKEAAATRLLPLVSCRALPDETGRSRACAALETFTELMIARMLVMGTVMLELLPVQRSS